MGYLFTTLSKIWETTLSAIGSHLTLSTGGILFLGFPVAFWGGAYGYAIATRAEMSLGAAWGIGLLSSIFIGILFAFCYIRTSNESFAVITLASVLAADALIRSWDALTGGVLGIAGVPRPSFASTLQQLLLFQILLAVFALILESILMRTSFGRALRALKENKEALTTLGISPQRIGQITVFSAALLTGIAGMVTVMRVQFLDPSLGGIIMLIQILTIAIIVHTPRTLHLVGMTFIIVLLPEALRFFNLPSSMLGYLRNLLYGVMLIALIHYTFSLLSHKRYV